MKILELRNISFGYGGVRVLQNVYLSLQEGEKVAIIGPNGAGKSTLLSVISGLLRPSDGEIFLSGRNVTRLPTYRRVRLGVARSFQTNSLFFGLTVIDNVLIALKGLEASRFEMLLPLTRYRNTIAQAQRLLESVNLWGKRNVPITDLSHGEQRQIEILLSIASKPRVLLLDEPSAGLSGGEGIKLAQMVRAIMNETTVLFVAHDLDLVFELSERIIVLNYGCIIAEGSPDEINTNQKVREIYLGTEGMVARTD